MKISSSILKPNINLLKHEFSKLRHQTGFGSSEETAKLRTFIDKQLVELECLTAYISLLDHDGRIPGQVFSSFKKVRHSFRVSSRTWTRIVSNEARIRKMQEKNNVATFAA